VPSAQPVGQLLRVTTHLSTELFKRESVDLLVPGQFLNNIIWTGNWIVPKEGDDSGHVVEINGPVMLPIPDAGSCHTDLSRDIFLIQSKLKAATAQVVAKGDWIFGQFYRWLNLKGNFYFVWGFL
jgi:hypothetical protein